MNTNGNISPENHNITQITVSPLLAADSRVWLFQDLSLQEGYPRPLSDLSLGTRDGKTAPGLNGLVWDSEEGPVWGAMGESAEKENDTWASLLQAGINGITTDTGGETICPVSYVLGPMSCFYILYVQRPLGCVVWGAGMESDTIIQRN